MNPDMPDASTVQAEIVQSVRDASSLIRSSNDVLVYTGAGISAESGIPTFRGEGGLWEEYRPSVYGNLVGIALVYAASPARIALFARDVMSAFIGAEPNPGHLAIAGMESMGAVSAVVTQNIDGLHQKSGSSVVLELHGSVYRRKCMKCGRTVDSAVGSFEEVLEQLRLKPPTRRGLLSTLREFCGRCESCGARNRPDVVFFGEGLPRDVLEESIERAEKCDVMLAVGTTAAVYPAAGVPLAAAGAGAKVIEVNPVPSPISGYADITVPAEAGTALPAILSEIKRAHRKRQLDKCQGQ